MFESIRNRWREARADVLFKETSEFFAMYERMPLSDRGLVISEFKSQWDYIREQNGERSDWSNDLKIAVAKALVKAGRQAFSQSPQTISGQMTRISAYGAGLLATYLEAQTLPGDQAEQIVEAIDNWLIEESVLSN